MLVLFGSLDLLTKFIRNNESFNHHMIMKSATFNSILQVYGNNCDMYFVLSFQMRWTSSVMVLPQVIRMTIVLLDPTAAMVDVL